MKYILLTLVTILIAGFVSLQPVRADVAKCQPIYGGGDTCSQAEGLAVDALTQHPTTKQFVDNLGANDAAFSPNQQITYRIVVKNTSKKDISRIEMKSVFPQYITYVSGPSKTFDARTKTLTFPIDKLKPNESKSYTISAKAAPADRLPKSQNTACMALQVIGAFGGTESADNTQFCIQKQPTPVTTAPQKPAPQAQTQPTKTLLSQQTTKGGLPVQPAPQVQQTPPTGSPLPTLLTLIPTGLAGLILRRYRG